MRKVLLSIIFPFFVLAAIGQNPIGIPDIINYTRDHYNAGSQNRSIVQDRNGIMYFANYEGLLTFDGTYWKLYPLPHKTVVRSLALGADDRIYVGSQADFGYFAPGANGKLTFTSLAPLIPAKSKMFSEIWETVAYGKDVFFRSREAIFQYSNNMINVYPANSEWQFMGKSHHMLMAQDSKSGVLQFSNGLWKPLISNNAFPKGYLVSAIFPMGGDSTFFATITSGFFVLTGKKLTPFKFRGEDPFIHQRILTAIPVTQDWLAIGTNLQGCYIVSKKGEIIENLSRKEGLQINNILYLFVDGDKNLWLGLDNGIDFVAFNNEIKHIYPEKLNEGEGYTARVFQNSLYIGTSNGLYQVPVGEDTGDLSFLTGTFVPVPSISGSSWGLSVVNDKLLFGHHDGAFQIVGGKAIPINSDAGFYNFLPYYDIVPSSLVIAGTSIGLDLLKYDKDRFTSLEFLPGFNEFSEFIAIDNTKTVWVAHPYGGVFKVDISDLDHPKTKLYNQSSGLPSSFNNHLFKVRNRVVVATEKGIYEYNPQTDRFELSSYFKNTFGTKNIRFLKEDSTGNIWFIEDKSLGVVDYSSGKPQILYFPELDGKMGTTFEFIYPYNQQNIFVGAEKGFYHINFEKYKKKYANNLSVKVTGVKAFGASDSLLYGGYFGQVNETVAQTEATTPKIGSRWNSLHFEFSSPLYEHENSLLYSYYLKGFDDKWSTWTKRTEKDYTNLPGGKYTFMVKVKNNLGSESDVTSYNVDVLPPWYETTVAYIIYLILFITFNYLFFRKLKQVFVRQREKHEEQQKHLLYLHQLELEKSEKEIVALRNEKLQAELLNKKTELASTSMHLIQKGDLLSKVKEELSRLRKNSVGEIASDDFKRLIRALKEEDHLDDEWQLFETHFDSVHFGFIRSLKKKFSNLTPNEIKLCAYLHMNLCSKEIAQHMKISVRGVEISRYRLRKKLQISKETNLYDFLLEVTSSDASQGKAV